MEKIAIQKTHSHLGAWWRRLKNLSFIIETKYLNTRDIMRGGWLGAKELKRKDNNSVGCLIVRVEASEAYGQIFLWETSKCL